MDLKIQGTLGLTQRDVKAVSDIDGVELAEGSYSTDVMSGEDDARKVLHLESIGVQRVSDGIFQAQDGKSSHSGYE